MIAIYSGLRLIPRRFHSVAPRREVHQMHMSLPPSRCSTCGGPRDRVPRPGRREERRCRRCHRLEMAQRRGSIEKRIARIEQTTGVDKMLATLELALLLTPGGRRK